MTQYRVSKQTLSDLHELTRTQTREAESQRLKREPGITAKRERVGIVDLADDDVKVIEERNIKRRCQRFEPGELIVLD